MSIDITHVGRAIADARKAVGITQQQLADAAGLTRSSIANVEAGRQRIPSTTLAAIAAELGTTTSQLLGENLTLESRIPTTLAVRITGQQREITRLLSEMADSLAGLAKASERLERLLAASESAGD